MKTERTLQVQNMSCGNCVRHVSHALSALPGVTVKDVQIGSATVEFDPADVSEPTLLDKLENAGYPATLQG